MQYRVRHEPLSSLRFARRTTDQSGVAGRRQRRRLLPRAGLLRKSFDDARTAIWRGGLEMCKMPSLGAGRYFTCRGGSARSGRSSRQSRRHLRTGCGRRSETAPQPTRTRAQKCLRIPRWMARLAGVEPAARGFEGRCSIQLSYRRVRLLVPPARGPRQAATPFSLTHSRARSRTLRFRGARRLAERTDLREIRERWPRG
jgi:hypothetical protein